MARKRTLANEQAKEPETIDEAVDTVLEEAKQKAEAHQHNAGQEGHPAEHTNGKSHAEAVGKKTYTAPPDPFGIATDVLAGVRLFESKKMREMALQFDEKPSEQVITKLKEAGYRWKSEDKVWAHPVRPESAMQTRINADKLFNEVSKMIRDERGITHSVGSPG